jgi:hypothetical protein
MTMNKHECECKYNAFNWNLCGKHKHIQEMIEKDRKRHLIY